MRVEPSASLQLRAPTPGATRRLARVALMRVGYRPAGSSQAATASNDRQQRRGETMNFTTFKGVSFALAVACCALPPLATAQTLDQLKNDAKTTGDVLTY